MGVLLQTIKIKIFFMSNHPFVDVMQHRDDYSWHSMVCLVDDDDDDDAVVVVVDKIVVVACDGIGWDPS